MYRINLPYIKEMDVLFFCGTVKPTFWLAATSKRSPGSNLSAPPFRTSNTCSSQPKKNWLRELNSHKINPADTVSLLYPWAISAGVRQKKGGGRCTASVSSCLTGSAVVQNPMNTIYHLIYAFSSKKWWCNENKSSLRRKVVLLQKPSPGLNLTCQALKSLFGFFKQLHLF